MRSLEGLYIWSLACRLVWGVLLVLLTSSCNEEERARLRALRNAGRAASAGTQPAATGTGVKGKAVSAVDPAANPVDAARAAQMKKARDMIASVMEKHANDVKWIESVHGKLKTMERTSLEKLNLAFRASQGRMPELAAVQGQVTNNTRSLENRLQRMVKRVELNMKQLTHCHGKLGAATAQSDRSQRACLKLAGPLARDFGEVKSEIDQVAGEGERFHREVQTKLSNLIRQLGAGTRRQ